MAEDDDRQRMHQAHNQRSTGGVHGLATWMIPPAHGWRRKGGNYRRTHLLLPLSGVVLIMFTLAGLNLIPSDVRDGLP